MIPARDPHACAKTPAPRRVAVPEDAAPEDAAADAADAPAAADDAADAADSAAKRPRFEFADEILREDIEVRARRWRHLENFDPE